MNLISRQYGEIEATKISVDLQMHEYRGLFDRINASGRHELSNIIAESSEFCYCYKHYLACQGKSVSDIVVIYN